MTVAAPERIAFRPQPGPQERTLASPADIVIAGGAAGGGKTWGLLLEVLRHSRNPDFGAVVFRRTYPQITNEGGLWDESEKLYVHAGAVPRKTTLEWLFPGGARVKFAHMQLEQDRYAWKGAQITLLAFDQLEDFTADQFWYLLSRNRSMCGVRPYVRATCNPVPEDDKVGSWLHKLIGWWVDQETGYPIEGRSGRIRWLVRDGDEIAWGDTREELLRRFPGAAPKSLTFIPATLEDNPLLMKADPGYRANLLALPMVERERLLRGNWKVRPTAGKVFNRAWFQIVDAAPEEAERLRYWDKAATQGTGDYSAGVRIARAGGISYIEHAIRGQWSAERRNTVMRQIADYDGPDVPIVVEQEPGSGGKESAEISVRSLAGFMVRAEPVTGDKLARAGPLAAQAEAGNARLVRGQWNEEFLTELHNFPEGSHDDQVDAASGAFNKLALRPGPLRFLGDQPPEDEAGRALREKEEQEERLTAAQESLERIVRTQGAYWPGRR